MPSPGEVCGKVVFCLCGPKGSLCCFVISLWAVIMLFLLGGFYHIEAVVLFEDLLKTQFVGLEPLHEPSDSPYWQKHGYLPDVHYFDPNNVTAAYQSAAYACWGAGVVYLFFLVLSGSFIGVNVWRSKVAARS